jgi:uncharacterized protein YlxW (UPF0749 family)
MSTAALPATSLPRPAGRVALLSMLLVFLCGAVMGALVMSYWGHDGLHGSRPKDGMSMSIREWKQELNLSDDQTRQLTSVLDDFSRYYDNLLADGNTRIIQILNEAQKQKYKRMIADHQKQ